MTPPFPAMRTGKAHTSFSISFPSEPMKTRLTNLFQAIAFLAVASLVIGSLAYCFAQLLIGGVQ